MAGNVALEIDRPLIVSHSTGKTSIKSMGGLSEQTESKNTPDKLSAKPSHNGIHESRLKFLSPKNRVRRRPTQTDKIPQDLVDAVALRNLSTEPSFTILPKTGVESLLDGPVTELKNTDWLTAGSGDVFIPEEIVLMRSTTDAHAQYRPHDQTTFSVLADGAKAHTEPTVNPSFQTSPPTRTPAHKNDDVQAMSNRMAQRDINRTGLERGWLHEEL